MKTQNIFKLLFMGLVCTLLTVTACKKDGETNKELKTYTLTIENAGAQDARCGIDLANGVSYRVAEGLDHQEKVDIAYGYMNSANNRYERCFLAISYAGCWCGGSSVFSYGDRTAGSPGKSSEGYSSYSVKNDTKMLLSTGNIDFDKIFSTGKKADLEIVFSQVPSNQNYADEVFFSSQDNMAAFPYIFFKTVAGKRGIIRVKGYTRNIATDYQLQKNPITIDVVVER